MPGAVSVIGKWVMRTWALRLARHFDRQVADCRATQQQTLHRLLHLNAGTRFQADHGLTPQLGLEEFRRRAPLTTYPDVADYVNDVRQGDTTALCGLGNRPLMFALTSGTTGATKYIPVTTEFLKDYRRGWAVWGFHAFEAYQRIPFQKFLQIASDHDQSRTPSGLPCGNISGLVQTMQPRYVRKKFVVPVSTRHVKDADTKQYLVLRFALAEPNVGLITTANPSTLVQLAQRADCWKESLIRDIHDGGLSVAEKLPDPVRTELLRRTARGNRERARQLSRIAERNEVLRPRDYWMDMSLVAVWTGGSAGAYLPLLRRWYGEVAIRDHGLSASEGRMTIPTSDETSEGLLDVGSHFFEFIPQEDAGDSSPPTLLAHEIEVGRCYFIVLTTASGLYRYNISDVVRCTGFVGTTPLLEFLHKGAHIASVTGEKLTESQVVAAVRDACQGVGCEVGHYTVTPVWGEPPRYHFLAEEGDLPGSTTREQLVSRIEEHLARRNCEYREKRRTGRLESLRLELIPSGTWNRYISHQQSRPGASAEQYKHPCLKPDLGFRDEVLQITDGRKKQRTETENCKIPSAAASPIAEESK